MNILGYNHFNKDEDALRIFQLYDPVRKKLFSKNLVNFGYFELLKPNVETNNQKDWQNFFMKRPLSATAPDYIRQASEIIGRANMRKDEVEVMTQVEKMQWRMAGELEYATRKGLEQGLEQGREEGREEGKVMELERLQPILFEKDSTIEKQSKEIERLRRQLATQSN